MTREGPRGVGSPGAGPVYGELSTPRLRLRPPAEGDGPLVFRAFGSRCRWALRLSRVGSLIVADNVVRGGAVADADSRDPSVRGVRALLAELGRQPRISATALQTVGCKGYDGLAIARVTAGP